MKKIMKNKKIMLSLICVVLVVGMSITYAVINLTLQQNRKGNLTQTKTEDKILAAMVDGEAVTTFPTKEDNYGVDEVYCDNNAIGTFKTNTWSFVVEEFNKTGTTCTASFLTSKTIDESDTTDTTTKEELATQLATAVPRSMISDEYSSSKAYSSGDYVIYNNSLYKFTSDKEAGEWDSSVVKETKVSDELSELNTKTPFSFGVDENGNYGYIKEGTDTVTPFSELKLIKNSNGGTIGSWSATIGKKYLISYTNCDAGGPGTISGGTALNHYYGTYWTANLGQVRNYTTIAVATSTTMSITGGSYGAYGQVFEL